MDVTTTVRRADVGQHLRVAAVREREPPVAVPWPDAAGQALVRVAGLEVVRVELRRLAGADLQRGRAPWRASGVEGIDAQDSRRERAVDDAHETLSERIRRGRERRREDRTPQGQGERHGRSSPILVRPGHRHDGPTAGGAGTDGQPAVGDLRVGQLPGPAPACRCVGPSPRSAAKWPPTLNCTGSPPAAAPSPTLSKLTATRRSSRPGYGR